MTEFLKVVKYEEAIERIAACFPLRPIESCGLLEASGKVLAQEIVGSEDLPAFNRSTVDGYAVKAGDSFGSSESLPAYLTYRGEIKMGQAAAIDLERGQCAWIPTGGMMPSGADAVVMVEYTERLGDDSVLVYRPVGPGENLMLRGEDVSQGQSLFTPSQLLRPQDIGFLASLGIEQLDVYGTYRIGIISTGDEIVPIQAQPGLGQVRDVNTYALAAAVKDCGSMPTSYPVIKDELEGLREGVLQALAENDLVLLSGGSSVGIMDVTIDVLMSIPGAELLFHGLAVKPGKPTLAVKIKDQLVIGLPGHPVSSLMMFYIICRPFLKADKRHRIRVKLSQNIASQPGRDDFIPISLTEGEAGLEPWGRPLLGKSGLMSILALASAYIHIPYEQQGVLAGSFIDAWLF
ncbi:MAG: molybdopterin molybdotransferase MoeA [Syntrophomonadaceae bacterium]|jgi:molybdopterin molybdotransferase|nr:molybdopterin molybdotransferase MoeA [Syntrophomonadaceae bacterium]